MFYFSKKTKSRIIHYEGCSYIKNIKTENLASFSNVNAVRRGGFVICSCCSPIMRLIKKEQPELDAFCLKNGLAYFLNKGNLHIRTYYSKWKILFSDDKNILELHHKSDYEKEHDDSVPGYHKQNYRSDSIIGYMKYIIEHEHYRMLNPLPIFTKKEPATKGTKRWNKRQKALKKVERRRQIRNVLDLIDSLAQ